LDDELEQFKQKINMVELADSYGYEIDRKARGRASVAMKNHGSKIIVATAEDGHGIFFDVRGNASGSVIDFVMWQDGINLGYARKKLREYSGQRRFSFPTAQEDFLKPVPVTRDRAGVIAAWERMKPCKPEYLEGRGLNARTISKFAEQIRTDPRSNTCFLHEDADGVCGWEVKNRGFTGFPQGGRKALFSCRVGEEHPGEPPAVLVVTEGAIDAMSYYQLHPADGLYVSIAGNMSPEQREQLSELLTRYPQTSVIIATDKDKDGEKYADFIRSIRPDAERAEPPVGKDWNDSLNQRPARAR
jgi:DNA primase